MTLIQRWYNVDRRRGVISTHINVETTLSVFWEETTHGMVAEFSKGNAGVTSNSE